MATFYEANVEDNFSSMNLKNNTVHHELICEYMTNLYARKNDDYGDSFHLTFLEEGWAMPRIRLSDKLNRFKMLSRAGDSKVKDESLRDTLIDLANYAVMSVMELDRLTAEAAKEKPSDASDYGFVTAEQAIEAAETLAKTAAEGLPPITFGNKAAKENPQCLTVVDVILRSDGSQWCRLCGSEIVRDFYGEYPQYCPGCGRKLKYPEVSV